MISVEVDVDPKKEIEKKPPPPPIDEKAQEKEEEKALKEFNFYHGFLPREDLLFLLKVQGDYLLRISEVGGGEKTGFLHPGYPPSECPRLAR
ncbi:hypothetical protein ANCDUO_08338 [Ancylostoma duodenale]|uniref:SH2 domain-containing protein n=1 Tax=Ancylostoma duodenale TaxID=51022 RepID=A0A0C2DG26_9BILA|nr:hypothetical protein ANCDUO_08338 [Ancylostoma duodenale]